jgi:hypothetical protein
MLGFDAIAGGPIADTLTISIYIVGRGGLSLSAAALYSLAVSAMPEYSVNLSVRPQYDLGLSVEEA